MSDLEAWFRRDADGRIDAYKCTSCDAWHEGLPLAWHAEAPAQLAAVAEDEFDERVTLGSDQCVITLDGTHHFMRGLLRIPIHGYGDHLEYGVWYSLSEATYERASDLWETEGRESEPPYFGWLSTALWGYEDTMYLKSWARTQPVGERPLVEVFEPEDHPLVVDQREGIDESRLMHLVGAALGVVTP